MHAFYLSSESRLEGWLAIPNRANIKRYGWKKQVRLAGRIVYYSIICAFGHA